MPWWSAEAGETRVRSRLSGRGRTALRPRSVRTLPRAGPPGHDSAATAPPPAIRLVQQTDQVVLPDGGERVRAVPASPITPGDQDRPPLGHPPDLPLQDPQLGRVDQVIFEIDRNQGCSDPLET